MVAREPPTPRMARVVTSLDDDDATRKLLDCNTIYYENMIYSMPNIADNSIVEIDASVTESSTPELRMPTACKEGDLYRTP